MTEKNLEKLVANIDREEADTLSEELIECYMNHDFLSEDEDGNVDDAAIILAITDLMKYIWEWESASEASKQDLLQVFNHLMNE